MSGLPLRIRAGRLGLDVTCFLLRHRKVDRNGLLGCEAGCWYCTRCGKSGHA